MSLTLLAIVSLNCDLTTDNLNGYAKDLALPIKITHVLDLKSHSGFMPVELNGEKSGVETYYDESLEDLHLPQSDDLKKMEEVGVVTFRWGSDFREGATAFYMAYILGAKCQAVAFETEGGNYMSVDDVKNYALLMLETE